SRPAERSHPSRAATVTSMPRPRSLPTADTPGRSADGQRVMSDPPSPLLAAAVPIVLPTGARTLVVSASAAFGARHTAATSKPATTILSIIVGFLPRE